MEMKILIRQVNKIHFITTLFNPIPRQALGYAEWVRGEQIHPRTLAVNTAFILQGIQFFSPLNKYLILS